MLFNSLDFAIFLPVVFFLYWFAVSNNLKLQNLLIVAASFTFYAWWDWRFLFLIIFSIIIDYSVGLGLKKYEGKTQRKILLWISIIANLGFLGFFKYFNFFIENFIAAFTFFGSDISGNSLNIILPVGISFYTFQTLSYTIDIYRKKLEPTTDFIAYTAFVSFFPQLVAGPIERATNLLPQFYEKRVFNYNNAVDGLRQILWGLFKKIVIADNCAIYVNLIFSNSDTYSGSTLALGALFFAFQLYADFSGYSDIAIGTARLFGINLMQNFAFPFFSRDIAEFWTRWHISLTTWVRDYLLIPLGGFRGSVSSKIRNIFIIFIIIGFWHGANWTFIVFGILNALLFITLFYVGRSRQTGIVAEGKILPTLKELRQMVLTFSFIVFCGIVFRAENITHAIQYISEMFSNSFFTIPQFHRSDRALAIILFCLFFMLAEWIGRDQKHALEFKDIKKYFSIIRLRTVRWTIYSFIIFLILMCKPTEEIPFVYFQF